MENSAACTTFILPIVLLISQMMFTSLFVTSLISSLSYNARSLIHNLDDLNVNNLYKP